METRDLLLLIGFLRGGRMFPAAVEQHALPSARSLRLLFAFIGEEERRLFGAQAGPSAMLSHPTGDHGPVSGDRDELRTRSALTSWSGDYLEPSSRIGEVPDPGVILCLLYDGPAADAALPIDVFAQTLRRFALRDPGLRARFEAHVDASGTFVPPWLSPELRRQRSQEAFDRAMKMAREQGFSAAAPVFEGVRGDCFAPAQIAVAVYELRELGDAESALSRLDEVVRVAPRNVAARLQRAQVLAQDPGRRVEAAEDWLAVLRQLARTGNDGDGPLSATYPGPGHELAGPASSARGGGSLPIEVQSAAVDGLWSLCREYGNPRKLEAAATLAKADPARGFEAVSRYVHTHPCAWDAHLLLASLALGRQSFDLAIKLLVSVRWLFPDDPTAHFVYGQALAAKGHAEAAIPALEHAARLAPADADIARWLAFTRGKVDPAGAAPSAGIAIAHNITRTLLLLVGFVRQGRLHPAALALRRVPGDVSLAIVVQALAAQEQRRFGDGTAATTGVEIDLRPVGERTVLLDYSGARLHIERLIGDVADPGVLVTLLFDGAPPEVAAVGAHRATLLTMAQTDSEIAAKMEKHLASPDATIMARLDLR
jgi:tetratricopeptide (TPR) repeat protein